MTDLDLIETDALIQELANRHVEQGNACRLFVKTRQTTGGRKYDVVDATEMLTSAQDHIVRSCFGEEGT